jgi:hypothetical protein
MEMEDLFQDLFRLIEKASDALKLDTPCSITARAYLRMAEDATFELLGEVLDNDEYNRLRAVCDYSQNYCLKADNWEMVAFFMEMFWKGVYDGFFGNSKEDDHRYYLRGYAKIRHRD